LRFLPQQPEAAYTFIAHQGFSTQILAYMLDSLVRVSRRVNENHFVRIAKTHVMYPSQYSHLKSAELCSPPPGQPQDRVHAALRRVLSFGLASVDSAIGHRAISHAPVQAQARSPSRCFLSQRQPILTHPARQGSLQTTPTNPECLTQVTRTSRDRPQRKDQTRHPLVPSACLLTISSTF
jgi:hypothetical protein